MDKLKAGIAVYNTQTDEVALMRMVDGQVCFTSAKMSQGGEVEIEDIGMNLADCREATATEKIAMQQAMITRILSGIPIARPFRNQDSLLKMVTMCV